MSEVIEAAWAAILERCKKTEPSRPLIGKGPERMPDNPRYLSETDVRKTWARALLERAQQECPANVKPMPKRKAR